MNANSIGTYNLRVECLPCLNYAMVVNGRKCLEFIEISNPTDEDWHEVHVDVSGSLFTDAQRIIDRVPAGQTVRVTDLDVQPDPDQLRAMTESTETLLTVTVSMAEAEPVVQTCPVRVLAFDEWTGVSIQPALLTAFVTPNAPELTRVRVRAAEYLEKLTGSSSLDDYQTQDPGRVRAQVAAIYEALRSEGLVYSAPPASFEKNGQRVRLAGKVLSEKLGTCLDLSLLMASVLEACGLHALLVVQQGHAYVGCWLVDQYSPYGVSDDVSFLSKATADGIGKMVLLESTAITSSTAVPFEKAVEMGEHHLVADLSKFVLFCDVFRCRMEGIRPLPVRIDGVWQNQGLEHGNGTMGVKKMTNVDTDGISAQQGITRQQIWERKLLDFSLRNNLINIRVGRRVMPFVSFDIDVLEDLLYSKKDFNLHSIPSPKRLQPDEFGIYDSRLYKDELYQLVTEDVRHGRLNSYLTEDELLNAEKYLYRESRTALEENGANSLFMVFGLMRWYESEKSVRPRYAPLLLMPVDLIRHAGNNYVVRRRDEEMTINTTLVEMLRQQYQIDLKGLNPLPEDEQGTDVRHVLATIRAQLTSQPRWDVIEEAMLGLFSFNKFVMWNDIHNNADKMRRAPIIESLLKRHWVGTGSDEPEAGNGDTDARSIDMNVQPHELAIPVDVDSSQLEAVVESGEGRSFILYGPPGTGKSQTITNMIANALFHGKRVLFVAEKMAALEVVQKRLEKVGLGPFCLELHSNKVTKSHLLQQLQSTLELTRIKPPEEYEQASNNLFEQRRQLAGYIRELHRKQPSGLSLYDCICRYEAIPGDCVLPSSQFIGGLTDGLLQEAVEKVEALDVIISITGPVTKHQLYGLSIFDPSQQAQMRIADFLEKLKASLPVADGLIARINTGASVKLPHSLNTLRWVVELDDKCEALLADYDEQILSLEPQQLRARWNDINAKWFLPRFFAKRAFLKELRRYRAGMLENDVETLLEQLDAIRLQLREAGMNGRPHMTIAEKNTCKELLNSIDKMQQVCVFDDEDIPALLRSLPQWQQNLDKSRDWAQWCIRRREIVEMQLGNVIDYMDATNATAHTAAQALQKGTYKQLALLAIDAEPQLQLFNGLLFEETIAKYRKMAREFQNLTKKMLYCRLAANVPSQAVKASMPVTELGILKRYIATNGRGATIRHIMDQIPTLLPKLCPVMLMSPISVAQFIDLDQPPFDIVCFDEASQMPTAEAVGAIARGKALICVGDPKQMPPTSFFTTNAVDEEEADIDDMESILDDCITLSLPARYLTWHYRSRHESLIAFSNAQYYENRLYTFPSVDDRTSKVQLVPVNGTYDYGRTRSNQAEAKAIVQEVMRRLADDTTTRHSIGIVAFSKPQQNLIEDLLTDELTKQPELEYKAFNTEEPIFIKNLENVQGDERDVILFSVGYGPDKAGHVSMNFGPLNNAGGERRLNVAVTRARHEMMVFATLKPEQIDLRRSNARGVAGLKAFLEFAQNGHMAVNPEQVESLPDDTGIVQDVAAEIRKLGYEVDLAVGRSKFKVDIAVRSAKDEQNYILGILCDGRRYYETKTQRDREICQPSVLEGLGWRLMRIWAVDWLMNKERVMERIRQQLETRPSAETSVQEQTPDSPLPFAVSDDEIVEDAITMPPSLVRSLERCRRAGTVLPDDDVTEYVRFVMREQQGISLDILQRQFAKAVGAKRRTMALDDQVRRALARLMRTGEVVLRDGNVISTTAI